MYFGGFFKIRRNLSGDMSMQDSGHTSVAKMGLCRMICRAFCSRYGEVVGIMMLTSFHFPKELETCL